MEIDYTNSIQDNSDKFWYQTVENHIPNMDKLSQFGESCDEKFPTCPLLDFTSIIASKFTK